MSIQIESVQIFGWNAAIRGMRNPKNSWAKSDSFYGYDNDTHCEYCIMGEADHKLAMTLVHGGSVHAKFRRYIKVSCDFVAPMYWWKEMDTYKVGTTRNSCSTMHKIHVAPITIEAFSHDAIDEIPWAKEAFDSYLGTLEVLRQKFNETGEKVYWRALIQMLPDGFLMRATMDLNYEVLSNVFPWRKDHKLSEWHTVCDWIKALPYSELITGDDGSGKEKES